MDSKKKYVRDIFISFEDHHLFTIEELCNLGVFGNKYAARKALNNGELPFIKISERRRLIPKKFLMDFLEKKLIN